MSRLYSASSNDAAGTVVAFTDADWTLGGWFNSSDLANSTYLFLLDAAASIRQQFYTSPGGALFAEQAHASIFAKSTSVGGVFVQGEWVFVAAEYLAADNSIHLYFGRQAVPVAEVEYATGINAPILGTGAFVGGGTHLHVGNSHSVSLAFLGSIERPFGVQKALTVNQLECVRLGLRSILPAATPRFGLSMASGDATGNAGPLGPVTLAGVGLDASDSPPALSAIP